MDDITSPANDDITEGDPESLVNSPMVAHLLRPVDRKVVYMEEIKIESNMESIMEDDDEN